MKHLILTTSLCSLLTLPAMAATPFKLPTSFYVSLGAGLTKTNDSDWDSDGLTGNFGVKDTGNISAAIGTNITKNIRTELEVSYRKADSTSFSIDGVGPVNLSGNVKTWAYLANAYYDFMPDKKFNPYVSVGLGAAHHTGTLIGGGISDSGSDTVLAYQAGLGANYALTDKVGLWAGYRYLGSDKPDFGDLSAKYNANEFRGGLKFNF